MKSTLFALCIFCATAAWGQAANYLSSEPQPIQMSGHRLRASQRSMEQEQTLLVNSNNVYGHGERPLWEFPSKTVAETPLGDVARLLRNQHTIAKKAARVVEQ
jgi:hypothetical protein